MSSSEAPLIGEATFKLVKLISTPLTQPLSDSKRLAVLILLIIVAVTVTLSIILLFNKISSSNESDSVILLKFEKYTEYLDDDATSGSSKEKSGIDQRDERTLSIVYVADLYQIDTNKTVVRVASPTNMLEIEPPTTDVNIQTASVKELIISEQLTEKWLMFFMSTFHSLEKFTLDIDQLCMGSTDMSPAELSKMIPTVNVKKFIMTNDVLCNISTWIYKWKFPRLEHLILNNGIISLPSFVSLERFLKRYSRHQIHGPGLTLKVQFNNYTICALCDLTAVRKLKYIAI